MLKRLRSAHPMLYCLGAEVLFLGMLFVASLLSLLLILFVVRDIDAVDDYMLTFMQEAAGVLVAWLFLARTGKSGLLRRRGSGFFNGLLVGLYPIALIGYNAYNTLLFGRPEGDMLPAWHVVWFLIGMTASVWQKSFCSGASSPRRFWNTSAPAGPASGKPACWRASTSVRPT